MKNSKIRLNSYLLFLLTVLYTTQVNALADNKYKSCWDISFEDENMFCHGAVSIYLTRYYLID